MVCRYFLDQVAGWILELDRGKGIPFEGNYSAWLEAKNKRLSSESKSQVCTLPRDSRFRARLHDAMFAMAQCATVSCGQHCQLIFLNPSVLVSRRRCSGR